MAAQTRKISRGKNPLAIVKAQFAQRRDASGAGWRVIEGLGPRGRALAVLPQTDTPTRLSPAEIQQSAMLEYRINAATADDVEVVLNALPTHRLTPAHQVVAAASINDGEPVLVRFDQGVDDENNPIRQRNVFRNAMHGRATFRAPQGDFTLKVWAADYGVVLQQISIGAKTAGTNCACDGTDANETERSNERLRPAPIPAGFVRLRCATLPGAAVAAAPECTRNKTRRLSGRSHRRRSAARDPA